ncbi:LLM class flavin-dependent oxidoreductase [Mycobacterium florentinum]|uniref:LLM class flavin-dependent oxidoreductase n=1 Tax=Mycobacterium florentinum TaxID=292462 RepID=UPI0013D2E4D0|nr:LLM class flavin-dependent oxidoreductase [Mycobacterium florentinum]MCV7412318.1 LLM class flavin-dependent oxidoreductase [Mycobacterium florentinum]
MSRSVEVGVNYWPSRYLPPQAGAEFASQLEATGVVDWFQTWDQLVSFLPQALWRPDVTPMARLTADCDSYYNAAMVAVLAANATTRLNITTTLDAVRNGPAELLQQMLTLAAATPATVALQFAAGELKQCKPFGWKRSQGLARMEDIFVIVRKMLASDGLIDHEGKHWTYDGAWIGSHFPKIPKLWALGGGPQLIDIATSHADGFISMVPSAFASPDQWASQVDEIRAQLERKGRDPQAFTCGFWPFVLLYQNDDQRERLVNNPITKWMTAAFGRLHHGAWKGEGIDLIFPEDWHYALRMLPHQMSRAEVDDVVARVTPEMIEKSWLMGTPEEVAAQLRPWVDAGADYIAPSDLAPSIMEPEEQPEVLAAMIELCAQLRVGSGATVAT